MSDNLIKGVCPEKFNAVREAFTKNFEEDLECGASFAVTINGKMEIDIWGGFRDEAKTEPWEEDTIVNVFSTTKLMTALCVHMLVDRGLLDAEAPVAQYWPEFAQEGKEKLPVKYLLSHTSGLAGWDKTIRATKLYRWDKIVDLLANQKPWWEPGTQSGYHTLTHGFLLGELVRRVTGKTLGTFFREEVADPLNADFHIGLSEENDPRVGELTPPSPIDLTELGDLDPKSIAMRSLTNPIMDARITKTREWRAAEIPAANGQGNARSVAKITAVLACGGFLGNVKLMSLKTLEKSIEEQSHTKDLVLGVPIRFGLGWGLPSEEFPVSPNERAFFWGGWGGSIIIVDLDAKMSIAYVMNKMTSSLTGDPRSERLIEAVFESI